VLMNKSALKIVVPYRFCC